MSTYNFEVADTEALFDLFSKAAAECERCLDAKLPIPAYEQAIKASHVFNTLQARGVISVAERQAYIGRVRDLAKAACAAWVARAGWRAGGEDEPQLPALRGRLMADSSSSVEEIPARMQAKARNELARLFAECTRSWP